MPPITRWFIKTAIVYLLAGIILAFVSELPTVNAGPLLLPVYWHMIIIGWITQVIMGVSIWMFPRKKRHRKKTQSFSAVAAFWTLNTGLILRFLSEPFLPLFTDSFTIRVVDHAPAYGLDGYETAATFRRGYPVLAVQNLSLQYAVFGIPLLSAVLVLWISRSFRR